MPQNGSRSLKKRKSRKRSKKPYWPRRMPFKAPFSAGQKKVRLFYRNTIERLPGSAEDIVIMNLNGMWDFDFSNKIGDIQPTFYNQLLSSTGPYRSYQVVGWETKLRVSNARKDDSTYAGKLGVMYTEINAADAASRDTVAEVFKLPGVKRAYVNDFADGIIECKGGIRDHVPTIGGPDPVTTSGTYNGNPATLVNGYLSVQGMDNLAVVNYQLEIVHAFDVILYNSYFISS